MELSPVLGRRLLVVGAALAISVALVLAVGVVPLVRVATVPDIDPDNAIPAFQVAAGLHLLAASVLAFIALMSRGRATIPKAGAVVTGVAMMLFGFVLADAALAFGSVGMRTTTALLVLCIATDAFVGISVIAAALLRPGPNEHPGPTRRDGHGERRATGGQVPF